MNTHGLALVTHNLPNTTILVVDDHSSSAEALKMLLTLEGYTVLLASTGGAAIDLFMRHKPATVLLDINLPDTDGYSVARALREREHSNKTGIIALTGRADAHDVQQAIASGCDHHCSKPIRFEDLTALLIKARPA